MKIVNIELYKYFNLKSKNAATLTAYIPDETVSGNIEQRLRPAVLIVPGGGYTHVSKREGEPVAIKFMGEGFIPFVLEYSTGGSHYPTQQIEASLAMAFIRKCGKEYKANPCKVAAIGFSAGAHLACSLSCNYDEAKVVEALNGVKFFEENGFDKIKADALILCYPVISSNKDIWHKGSFETLSNGDKQLIDSLSLEAKIRQGFPPTYIWHTASDESVSVENSFVLAISLQKNNIPYELHVYERGKHGLSLADKTVLTDVLDISGGVANWFTEAITFLKEHGISM